MNTNNEITVRTAVIFNVIDMVNKSIVFWTENPKEATEACIKAEAEGKFYNIEHETATLIGY